MSLFKRLATDNVKRQLKRQGQSIPKSLFKHKVRTTQIELVHSFRYNVLILFGVLSASFGLKGFLLPNDFLDGGVMGISLITAAITEVPLSVLVILINIPFILLAFSVVNRHFAIKSIIAIVLLAVSLYIIPFPNITHDKLLISVFGGFFLGLGVGLSVRGGAVLDGTEVLAIFLNKKLPLSIGSIILVFNIIIFSVSAYIFNIEIALYAILTYLAASKTVDFVITGIEEYIGVSIISDYSEEVRSAIITKLGRGCTIYKGQKGYGKRGATLEDVDIIYTVLSRLEISKLQVEIEKIDSKAFIITNNILDAKGGMIKKRLIQSAN